MDDLQPVLSGAVGWPEAIAIPWDEGHVKYTREVTTPWGCHGDVTAILEWLERHMGDEFQLTDWQKDMLWRLYNRPVKGSRLIL